LNELQRYSVNGKIDSGILANITDVSIRDLVDALKDKNFSNMRKWVAENGNDDASRLFRRIYDNLYEFVEKDFIPVVVVILAKYQYQAAFVSDQELNTVACLTEIMCEASFK
jgi:hypothetical protein